MGAPSAYSWEVPSCRDLAQACAEAARRGGEVLRARWGQRRTIEYKGGADLVTDADRASEAEVLAFIAARFPGAAVLAEESGASGAAEAALRFVVDPLDGTTNYAHGLPQFAVNVAVEDAAGIAAGATYDPLRDELFVAARGEGATVGGERIQVTREAELRRSLLCTGFPPDVLRDPEPALRLFAAYLKQARAIRRLGSAALDLAYVACGRLDGFWEMRLKPWDLAPGILLVREAGGVVADFDGGQAMMATGEICAAGPALHPRLMEILRQVRGAG